MGEAGAPEAVRDNDQLRGTLLLSEQKIVKLFTEV